MSEEYDVPWEYARRTGRMSSMRASMPIAHDMSATIPIGNIHSSSLSPSSHEYRRSTSHYNDGRSSPSIDNEDNYNRERRKRRIDETCILRDMDRVEAEKRLHERNTGDFILRWREDGTSAALSLRAHEGVLHLKVDRISDRWIVGEGSRFRSISQAISFYRKNPLPIRGARHICLSECLSIPSSVSVDSTARL